jgi:putative RecB family exonuclease
MRQSDLPSHTSASQLATYASCPRRYELRYVLKLEPERRGTGLALGSAVHGAVQWWFEERAEREEPAMEQALRIFRADLDAGLAHANIDWRDTTHDELREDGERLVRAFLTEHGSLRVRGTEVAFELSIIDPVTGHQIPRRLVGYFDIELLNGNVVELKTARGAYSEIALATNLQFTAYRTAARYAGADVEIYALIRTKTPKIQHVVLPHHRDVSRWFMHAAASIERAIMARHFPPAPSPMSCGSCEYQRTCLGYGVETMELDDAEAA